MRKKKKKLGRERGAWCVVGLRAVSREQSREQRREQGGRRGWAL